MVYIIFNYPYKYSEFKGYGQLDEMNYKIDVEKYYIGMQSLFDTHYSVKIYSENKKTMETKGRILLYEETMYDFNFLNDIELRWNDKGADVILEKIRDSYIIYSIYYI